MLAVGLRRLEEDEEDLDNGSFLSAASTSVIAPEKKWRPVKSPPSRPVDGGATATVATSAAFGRSAAASVANERTRARRAQRHCHYVEHTDDPDDIDDEGNVHSAGQHAPGYEEDVRRPG